MDLETKKALCGSIDKWVEIVEGYGSDLGSYNCPLCKKFIRNRCNGCPVMAKTGIRSCNETPYVDWCAYMHSVECDNTVFDQTSKNLAIAELEFLISLYPED